MAINKWTVMFFFASDNALSPVIVSQLKAIKEAGFHEDAEVLVYFDASEKGVPTKIYNVNRERKRRRQQWCEKYPNSSRNLIGDGDNSFVHNLEEDEVKPGQTTEYLSPSAREMFKALKYPDDVSAKGALKLFLDFCWENHRAEHYILFLIGHGIIVGNDAFLPDENPVSSITLKELGGILKPFGGKVTDEDNNNNAFELLAMHSCSMSAIEVAYELQGAANFMLSSEGISYVNSWPYRQLLKKLFKSLEVAKKETGNADVDVQMLMEKLFFLSFFNAKDFSLSGYPLDLALCNLKTKQNFTDLSGAIQELVAALKKNVIKEGASDGRGQDLILLAHLESQSYWGETYTDLFDFCRCLHARCGDAEELKELSTTCLDVMNRLKTLEFNRESAEDERDGMKGPELRELKEEREKPESEERFKRLVIFAENFGSAYQYSHGLSVYFPWARPVENVGNGSADSGRKTKVVMELLANCKDDQVKELLESYLYRVSGILERYKHYAFTTELDKDSWLSFLNSYFDETQRSKTRSQEDHPNEVEIVHDGEKSSDFISGRTAPGGIADIIPSSISLQKDSPSSGVACLCSSIKNYPELRERVEIRGTLKQNIKKVSATRGAIEPPADLSDKSSAS
jgi:hypothetical protein